MPQDPKAPGFAHHHPKNDGGVSSVSTSVSTVGSEVKTPSIPSAIEIADANDGFGPKAILPPAASIPKGTQIKINNPKGEAIAVIPTGSDTIHHFQFIPYNFLTRTKSGAISDGASNWTLV